MYTLTIMSMCLFVLVRIHVFIDIHVAVCIYSVIVPLRYSCSQMLHGFCYNCYFSLRHQLYIIDTNNVCVYNVTTVCK